MTENQILFHFANPSPSVSADGTIEAAGHLHPVLLRRSSRARQYILRLRHDGTVVVTLPARGSKAEAWRFVRSRSAWIARQWDKLRARPVTPRQWKEGTEILLRGQPWPLTLTACDGFFTLTIGPESIRLNRPWSDLRPAAELLLQRLARTELPPRVHELAARESIAIRSVTIRNQSSRWGSCSDSGRISLNWRLIQMPPAVRDYVILHELMHRRQMNHSPRFWALIRQVCPDYLQHQQWIKTNTARLGL